MKVFLLSDVPNVGAKNTLVEVKDGYAKNFLIKKNLAIAYQGNNRLKVDKILNNLSSIQESDLLQHKLLKSEIEQLQLIFHLKTHDNKVFGKISHHDIILALKEKKIEISKFVFDHAQTFGLGAHEVHLKLAKTVVAKLKIEVIAQPT